MSDWLSGLWNKLEQFVQFLGPGAPSAGIALVSLFVAYAAYKNSRRATNLAIKSHEEHGRIKSVRIQLTGTKYQTNPDGVGYSIATPLPGNPEYAKAATVFSVYGGPDTVQVEDALVVVEYVKGFIFAKQYAIGFSLSDIDENHLIVDGPKIPTTLDAYHRADWSLPRISIAEYLRGTPPQFPGMLYIMPPIAKLTISFGAVSSGHHASATKIEFGKQWGIVTRRHFFGDFGASLSDRSLPEELHRLLQVWGQPHDPEEDQTT